MEEEEQAKSLLTGVAGLRVGAIVNTKLHTLDVIYDVHQPELGQFIDQEWVMILDAMARGAHLEVASTDAITIRFVNVNIVKTHPPQHRVAQGVKIDVTSPLYGQAIEQSRTGLLIMFWCDITITRAEEAISRGIVGSPLAFKSQIVAVSDYQDRVAPSALLLAVSLAVIGIAVDTASLQRRLSTRHTVSLRAPAQVGGATADDRIEVVSGASQDMVGLPVTIPQARRVSVLAVDESSQTVTLTAKLLPVAGGGPVAVASGTMVAIGNAVNDMRFLTPDRIVASVGASIGTTWMIVTLWRMYSEGHYIFEPKRLEPRITLQVPPLPDQLP
jgi:hypothetical protein